MRNIILIDGRLNAKIVGQKAKVIADMANINVPEDTKVLIGEVESVELSEAFAHEKLSPVLALYKFNDFEDAIRKAEKLIKDGGYGHTSAIYIDVSEKASNALSNASAHSFPLISTL